MGKELQTVEVFACPNCARDNYIEWDAGESNRSIACSSCFVEARLPQVMKDENGSDVVVEQITNAGLRFPCVRRGGKQFVARERDNESGREVSWKTTATGVGDPEGIL